MVKTRMGLLDLRVQTAKVNASLRGARVVNVYDAHNGRTYILKLSVPPASRFNHATDPSSSSSQSPSVSSASVSSSATATSSATAAAVSASPHHSSWEKRLLLIESGVRLHMTQFDREKDIPSGFCLKLRKHIRTRRLEAVRQLGNGGDRIIDLVFSGEGATCAHLIVEAFAGGNVILTDADYTILTLLRTYKLNDAKDNNNNTDNNNSNNDPTRVAVRERYPVDNARMHRDIELDEFVNAGRQALDSLPSEATSVENVDNSKNNRGAKISARAARRKLYARGVARKALAVALSLEPTLLEHALITAGFESDAQLADLCANDFAGLRAVYAAFVAVDKELKREMQRGGEMKGYIVSKISEDGHYTETYDEFAPYLFAQYQGRKVTEFNSFDEAADEFFARLESERVDAAQAKREAAAFKKVDKLEVELNGQVTAFERSRDKSWEMAQAVENNIEDVEAAIMVIRSAIAAAVPWDGLAKMVQDEKLNGNPVAEIIHSLQLDRNQMTLMLEDTYGDEDEDEDEVDDGMDDGDDDDDDEDDYDDDDDDDDDSHGDSGRQHGRKMKRKSTSTSKYLKTSAQSRTALLVSVDINLSAHANARRHYESRKSAAAKMEKAAEVKDRTIKAASRKAVNEAAKLEQEAVAASIRARRRALWFEKFYWFVSSENYLVVAGRDAQQNELLVKRYLGPTDVYVHADVEGASSVIVKNNQQSKRRQQEVPRMTLEEAGSFAMCRSAAWDSKIVTSAWWVRATQVSKYTSMGQYLPTGHFAIRGKKNFLNPQQLVMGLAFLFKVDEESAVRHRGERCVRGMEGESDTDDDDDQNDQKDGSCKVDGGQSEQLESTEYPLLQNEANIQNVAKSSNDLDGDAAAPLVSQHAGVKETETSQDVLLVTAPITTEEAQSSQHAPDTAAVNAIMSDDVAEISAPLNNLDLSGQASLASVEAATTDNRSIVEDEVDSQQKSKPQKPSGKKRLSAKEKRVLRNAKNGKRATDEEEDSNRGSRNKNNGPNDNRSGGGNRTNNNNENGSNGGGNSKPKGGNALPRGKKHKLKKMKKYLDQDDEERRIALAVLGSKPIKEELQSHNQQTNDTDNNIDTTRSSTKNDAAVDGNDHDDDGGGSDDNKGNKRPSRDPKQEDLLMMDEEGMVELSRLEVETSAVLNSLTGMPMADDVIECALPVCAPLQAVAKYRYRTKLMPGNMKRGKAYRAAVVLFQKQAEKDLTKFKQERDAIRTTPESDGIHSMLGNVKIMAAGLADAQKVLAKSKKKTTNAAVTNSKKGKK